MGEKTGIAWTDATWNPGIFGCLEVSPGCAHCYAAVQAERLGTQFKQANYAGLTRESAGVGRAWTGEVRVITEPRLLNKPLGWREPRRIFVNSMSDLFHDGVPFDHIDRVFDVMQRTPRHTYQILTKRPQRMQDYARSVVEGLRTIEPGAWPLPNVWLGVSVEDQRRADERVPLLQQTPAAVRFLSMEPLLETVTPDLNGIGWVIVGGESGAIRRPFEVGWAESIADQCERAGVAYFGKQIGAAKSGVHIPGRAGRQQFPSVGEGE